MEDLDIIGLFWKRCETAIHFSQEKYGTYCFSLAYHILENQEDCEECVSDTWLHAWNTIPPQKPNALRMFFAKLTRNLAFDRWRHRSAEKRGGGVLPLVLDELSECIPSKENTEDQVIARDLEETVRAFLRTLQQREGDIFLRRYFFTESIEEIASSYGLTRNHVSVILGRTRKLLKNHLIQEGYCDEG
jgi:RNA polymerase sigma factor (sigma-70 family)